MNHLELFSGTHSFGKVSKGIGYNVVSLDRDLNGKCPFTDYESENHIMEDIMTWDYKIYPKGYFKIITASPVCLWWSRLRNTWIGRKLKSHGETIITKDILQEDIENLGIPMVEKVFEIIDYFEPAYYIIENPESGTMKEYINDLIPFYDFDYCKYSNWGYNKKTRFWTNIGGIVPKICNKDCDFIENGLHINRMGVSKSVMDEGKLIRVNTAFLRNKYKDVKNIQKKSNSTSIFQRYRIPEKLIEELFKQI